MLPMKPSIMPSKKKGVFMYVFEAPTKRMISICLFLLLIVIFIVLLIRNAVTMMSPITMTTIIFLTMSNILTNSSTMPSPYFTW